MDFLKIVSDGVSSHASDIHLSTNNRPAYRINGRMHFLDLPALTPEEADGMIRQCLPPEKYEEFRKSGDMDASAEISGCGRFRINAFRQVRGDTLVMRIINANTPEIAELHLPDSISRILELQDGLVLVTGPTGSGKSTTLAAIINEFNKNRHCHIITIEDPIEYMHTPKNSIVNQREIGSDSISYARALKAALREDPDIILVGEMRDLESISIAVTAAETGHLVLSTLHTIGAAKTIDRLIDVFPPEQQQQIRIQLSLVLKSVISQRLLPTADGKGRVGAFEMMFINSAISNLIREGRTANIAQSIQTGVSQGMITLERSVDDLVRRGIITSGTAGEFGFAAGARNS
ncbi:type IV pilus twitching motility protein PilT [Caproiciproducens faecalis]|uniref:Type IV pilus twitching motility protein PilT n=1 Tax=Caproiciproducens faecalis TaxID=2820301 RepID=A0ABS7DJS5_9FIRM|nr:type IV pilus twitching motility protein PilT [Caproiciproducens faecalis]MBW7571549.1 type IV pilus twitching motility protein PilT [Caproiciproducens faecalis]